ncbi:MULTISPECIES: hypothetical protein [Kitasatospora]|uniref:Alpha-L-arabinofuranosidase n=1 Tax=Kitasatospora cystarginea TaxID=58350 RepID=A0ABN3F0W0_9ACTN
MSKHLAALAVTTALLAGSAVAPAVAAESSAGTEIAVGSQVTNSISDHAVGVDTPFWNENLLRDDTPELIRRAGIRTLSFDAGWPSDLYHFQNGGSLGQDPTGIHAPVPSWAAPKFSFDKFAETARVSGAGALVHVNYGTGDAKEAADWVRYANVTHGYRVRDWAIGEEVYLNGWSGRPPVEPDGHPDRSPAAYARNSIEYAKAMKAVDPTIRVGVELAPYDLAVPDPLGTNQRAKTWDDAVLSTPGLAAVVDFVDIHWYHSRFLSTDAAVLADTAANPPVINALRADLDHASGPGRRIDIVVGETNVNAEDDPRQQTAVGALYLLDNNLSLLENGASNVSWWALYNGPAAAAGGGWGDLGLLSSGDCVTTKDQGDQCEPPVGTPFPTYQTMRLLTTAVKGGGSTLATSSTSPTLTGHAVRRADGALAVVVVNKDPNQAQEFHLSLPGSYRTERTLTWRQHDTALTVQRGLVPAVLAPYSAAVILLKPAR